MASAVAASRPHAEYSYPVSDPVLANLLDACHFCVGTLHPPPESSAAPPNAPPESPAAVALVALLELAHNVFGLVTSARALPDADVQRVCRAEVAFRGFGRLGLRPADVASLTRDEALDALVVELTEPCAAQLRARGARFLRAASARLGDQVALVLCERNDELAVFKGVVHAMGGDAIHYDVGVHVDAVGSPLLLWNGEAVGLVNRRSSCAAEPSGGRSRLAATRLLDVVAAHLVARASPGGPSALVRHIVGQRVESSTSAASSRPTWTSLIFLYH